MSTSTQPLPHVVVVGAGFAGLHAARALRRKPVRVTLIDRNNFHTFQPLLYQVATAGLAASDISKSVRHILHGFPNVHFRMDEVVAVDREAREIETAHGDRIGYDYLILALGAVSSFFGMDSVEERALPLKFIEEGVALRNHVLRQFEAVGRDPGLIEEGALTFVIVGGGPTGVETAGALTELFRRVLHRDFPDLDIDQTRVILVEQQSHLLAPYAPNLRDYTRRALDRMGVDVRLDTALDHATDEGVVLKDGTTIKTRSLIWAAGIRAHPLADTLGAEQRRGGRIATDPDLRLPDHPEVFIAGDMAGTLDENGDVHPQLAQYAMQTGRHAARQILRLIDGKPTEPFTYKDYGEMATIGRHAAVAQFPGGVKMKGVLAWLGWLFLHLLKLVGFRNRLSVFMNWTWNYFTYDQAARLILDLPGSDPEPDPADDEAASLTDKQAYREV